MLKRLLQRWLNIKTINFKTIVKQGEPRKHFVSVKVVQDINKPDEQFDLILNLAMVTSINGVKFKDIDQDYSYIRFVYGDQYYTPFDIDDLLEMLGIEDDEDDNDNDDDEPTTNDDPPELTKEQFDVMMLS